jgi:hypothetical protein
MGRENREKAKWCGDVRVVLLHGRKVANVTGAARGAKSDKSKMVSEAQSAPELRGKWTTHLDARRSKRLSWKISNREVIRE